MRILREMASQKRSLGGREMIDRLKILIHFIVWFHKRLLQRIIEWIYQ